MSAILTLRTAPGTDINCFIDHFDMLKSDISKALVDMFPTDKVVASFNALLEHFVGLQ